MEKTGRGVLLAVVVAVVVVLLFWAWDMCYLGRFSRAGCPGRGSFCGGRSDPAAMSEAAGLYELGARPESFCSSTPAPAALAEEQGLMQMGWRPERMIPRPSCLPPHPAAVSEAQSLQHANALRPGAPFSSGFERFGGPVCCGRRAAVSPEALGETRLLYDLQALSEVPDSSSDFDSIASQKIMRGRHAFSSVQAHAESLRSNPAQIPARQARLKSMREGFGGPAETGFGWTPNAFDAVAAPLTGGWGDARLARDHCMNSCVDGCTGTHCHDHCKDVCF